MRPPRPVSASRADLSPHITFRSRSIFFSSDPPYAALNPSSPFRRAAVLLHRDLSSAVPRPAKLAPLLADGRTAPASLTPAPPRLAYALPHLRASSLRLLHLHRAAVLCCCRASPSPWPSLLLHHGHRDHLRFCPNPRSRAISFRPFVIEVSPCDVFSARFFRVTLIFSLGFAVIFSLKF
jgi:hypothetical protein